LPSPVEVNGHITLGSFNKLPKITDQMLWLWARLLKEIPGARLLIQAQGADQASFAARIGPIFGSQSERVTRRGLQPMGEYLRTVSSVDVALDTFPFNGHTTTCHALWMGAATVTLAGALPLGRVGRSLLGAVGLQEFAAEDGEALVRVAAGFCGDRVRLLELRQSLRRRMRQSALVDATGLARNVEMAFRTMWMDYLRRGFRRE